jgi:hypothetical protein
MKFRVESASGHTPPCQGAYEGVFYRRVGSDHYYGPEPCWFIDLEEVPDQIDQHPVTVLDASDYATDLLLVVEDRPDEDEAGGHP